MTIKTIPIELLSEELKRAIASAPVAVVFLNRCWRCGWVWAPRADKNIGETDECPGCHSPYWRTPRSK